MLFHFFGTTNVVSLPWLHAVFMQGSLGLKLFFIISGFIIPYSMWKNNYMIGKFPGFLLKRIVRIEPPYVMSIAVIVCAEYLLHHYHQWEYAIDWKRIFFHLGYLNRYFGYAYYSDVYWTLAIEFQFYILIALFFPVIRGRLVFSIPFIVLFTGIQFFFHFPLSWFIFEYAHYFSIGIITFLFMTGQVKKQIFLLLLVAVLAVPFFDKDVPGGIMAALAVPVILFLKRRWKVTDFLGRISYSLYLTHLFILGYCDILLGSYFSGTLATRLMSVVIAFGFAILFYYLVEKPSLRLSKRIRY